MFGWILKDPEPMMLYWLGGCIAVFVIITLVMRHYFPPETK